jgi:NADH-quinone oxidoreductase subunit L
MPLMATELIGIAIFLPLLGFIINGLFSSRIKNEAVLGSIGSGTVGISFAIAVAIFIQMLHLPVQERSSTVVLFPWIAAGGLDVRFSYQIDQLSIVMMLIVTGVGFLIHLYSIGYIHGDRGVGRFFAYMNLFIFAMLNLIMADNFLLLFLGWEGVGLCSYLLIGFWYDRKFEKGTTGDAAKKAFIVNRIGDFGFLIGMFLIFTTFGTLSYRSVFAQAEALPVGSTTALAICLALFMGATGKSAQIPLFVWLPDAMAGPTPVSALIHAATMVTAGVYMVARCSVLFALAPAALTVVGVIGALTAVFAATIGLVQNDIKKVLAYSTISQLGYMFLSMGVGAFSAGIFHLMTHAFFKALLFLGAGSVIHALHGEQDIRKMGGLKKDLPLTYWTFLVAAIAISGIPPFSGFFSKDEILWQTFANGHWLLWLIGFLAAGLTAFYMFRLTTLTFLGEARWGSDKHPHESPRVMTLPLAILALLSLVGGFIGVPMSLGGSNAFEHWLDPVFERARLKMTRAPGGEGTLEIILMVLSVAIAALGIALALSWYLKRKEVPARLVARAPKAYGLLLNKYYVDEIYEAGVVQPVVKVSEKLLWRGIDVGLIDWSVNAVAKVVGWAGRTIRVIQTGVAETYVFVFLLGVVVILGWLIAKL